MNLENEDGLLPGTETRVRTMTLEVGAYSPTVVAAWAFQARSAPEDHMNALVARVSRMLLHLASTSAEITPVLSTPFAYVQEKYGHDERESLTVSDLWIISFKPPNEGRRLTVHS